jgi:hypothetical protein
VQSRSIAIVELELLGRKRVEDAARSALFIPPFPIFDNSPVQRTSDLDGSTFPVKVLVVVDFASVVHPLVHPIDRDLGDIVHGEVVVQQGLEDEIVGPLVGDVHVCHELVSRQGDDIGEFVLVLKLLRRRRGEESDRDALVAVHDDLVEGPVLDAGETMLLERSVLGGRGRRGAEDWLAVSIVRGRFCRQG